MATIGQIDCQLIDANQGRGKCSFDIGLIELAIAIPKGTRFANADITDMGAFVKSKLYHDNPALRWQAMSPIVNLEDGTTAAGTESGNYGGTWRVGKDSVVWTARYRGGHCAYNNTYKFRGTDELYDWLYLDSNGQLLGRKRKIDGIMYIYGIEVDDVYVPMWTPGNNSAEPIYNIEWRFTDSNQLTRDLGVVVTGMTPSDFKSTISVELEVVSTAANGVYNIKTVVACGGQNIGETYHDELDVTTAFLVTDELGAALTYTITWNPTTKYFVFDVDQTDTDYPTVGEPIHITPAAISVWTGLNVGDPDTGIVYEGQPLIVQAT